MVRAQRILVDPQVREYFALLEIVMRRGCAEEQARKVVDGYYRRLNEPKPERVYSAVAA